MAITREQWLQWSPAKREFFAKLFTCYIIADDGMLRIDEVERRKLVREQLEKQSHEGAEKILKTGSSANYIITNSLQADGETLKPQEAEVKTLSSLRSKYESLQRRFNGEETKDPIQYSLVGGFRKDGVDHLSHFKQVVGTKMLYGHKYEETRLPDPRFLSLGPIHDLTFPMRCSLNPEEMLFLIEDATFQEKIRATATKLHRGVIESGLSVDALQRAIIDHIKICSTVNVNQKSLDEICIPTVDTYLAMYRDRDFDVLSQNVCEISKVPPDLGFYGTEVPLERLLSEGALNFTFPPEYRNLLKALILLKGPFAGQKISDIEAATERYTVQRELTATVREMFVKIVTRQIAAIKEGTVPPPPANMGTRWDFRRSTDKLFNILQNQCIDLYVLAEMAGFSKVNAHLAYGLHSQELLESLNREFKSIWQANEGEMRAAFKRAMTAQFKEYEHDAQLKENIQPSGVNLHVVPKQPAERLVAPRQEGLFGEGGARAILAAAPGAGEVKAGPLDAKAKLLAAALQRQQQKEAEVAEKQVADADRQRVDQLAAMAAEVAIVDGADVDDDDRARMMAL